MSYTYKDTLTPFENEAVAGGIATCKNYNEFLEYYRMIAYHGRPGETYRQSQKRAAALWAHVRTYRETYTPPTTPPAEEKDDHVENICPICNESKPAADEDGHCSYECASGGGLRQRVVHEFFPSALAPRVSEEESLNEDLGAVGITIVFFMAVGYWFAMLYYSASHWHQ